MHLIEVLSAHFRSLKFPGEDFVTKSEFVFILLSDLGPTVSVIFTKFTESYATIITYWLILFESFKSYSVLKSLSEVLEKV